ncbi:MAG TPA: alpha-2-macroglobulin [Pricia antarctica]|uniref:Alpha-2-macroglobulin n=3 Tax=root TaxID=1 RepID=A0A831VNC9_9FLAO|nr:alpha-2-macroglobulin [Pricia antarctica]
MLILAFSLGHAQSSKDSYDSLWEKVANLEKDELTKSALEQVKIISAKAKKEKNSAQVIKALLFTSKYALILEEDAQLNIIDAFRFEIKNAESPTKNVLESYLANLYWQYFQQNRYKFYDRTKTESKVDSTDFRTWDLTTLFYEISAHFDASLKNKEKLQNTGLKAFKEIVHTQTDSEKYRPTLFDVLAHSALDFYKTDESDITRPADQFQIDDPELLSEAYTFTQQKIETQDRTSLQSKALIVYQDLLKFHYPDADLDALVDVDIERLAFIYEKAVFADKEELYLEVLKNSAENLGQHEVSALYTYKIAELYVQQGNTYDPKSNDENRWKQKEALTLCDSVIAQFPNSRGAKKCEALKSEIIAADLQLKNESIVPVQEDSRLLVNYKNLGGLRLSALSISQKQLNQLNNLYKDSEQREFLQKLAVAKTWEATLIDKEDYQMHSIEILLPGLDNGQYVILATPLIDDTSTFKEDSFAFSPVQVTNMALVSKQLSDAHQFQVIHRRNGHPVSKVKVQLSYLKNHKNDYLKQTLTADTNGIINIPLSKEYRSDITVTIAHENDKATFGPYYIDTRYNLQQTNDDYSCFLITDRSIYRPGQPLYFKGIAVRKSQGQSSILENTQVQVDLKDVNGQTVATQQFITNDYGSFAGEFILPDSGLTGNFSLQVTSTKTAVNGYTSFSVEEYKRPKFETSFDPVTETFRINDSITVRGSATAYAGSNITEAKVLYSVRRVVYFPMWYYWHFPYVKTIPQEIAHGETATDASGNYEINFKALPDNSLSKEDLPTFQYEVTADVTDINGETHSATSIVSVGYHAISASIEIPDRLNKAQKTDTIFLVTNNLNNQPIKARGTLKMYKLQAPDNVLRPRPWPAPDYENWEKEDFKKRFPHEAIANEDDPTTWDKGDLVWESDFNTGISTEVPLKLSKKWDSGKYLIELKTSDALGQEVKALAQTTLYSESDKKSADRQLFQITTDKQKYSIGDMVEVKVSSAADELSVSIFIEKNTKIVDTHVVDLSGNTTSFMVPVNPDDLGGFAINYSFSAFNAFTSGNIIIAVPYPKTDLTIETQTFRDKLAPGTDETWAFTIKGPKGDRVTAEFLASMYDASLDAFIPHDWLFNPLLQPTYYSRIYTNARESFGVTDFRTFLDNNVISYTAQSYDTFNWFQLYFGRAGYDLLSNGMIKRSANKGVMAIDMMENEEAVATSPARLEDDLNGKVAGLEVKTEEADENGTDFDQVQIRKNLQETAFFFPQLQTDSEGNVSFNFTTPEVLTKWKLQLLAHTKSLESAVRTLESVTQKDLMVIPNTPRFLREGDEITISSKIVNLTEKLLQGQAKLVLIDALTNIDISGELFISSSAEGAVNPWQQVEGIRNFKLDSMGNTQVSWRLNIPNGIQAIQYKIIASAGNYSDGEQNLLPVLTNRKLVTETLPMSVRSGQTKTFTLEKLKDNTSTTLQQHKLTLEITSNPAWFAVQALPYLMEYPYDCNEQTFARYYANALASHIANSNDRIQEVFKQWANSDALLSNLEKNEELKSILIQETPWVRDAQTETEQKKRIALLFNLDKMKNERNNALNKLRNGQSASGAWPWFNGGPDNRFITQHIVTGMGHLEKLITNTQGAAQSNALTVPSNSIESEKMLKNAIAYLDCEFLEEYAYMKNHSDDIDADHLSMIQIHYLYMRSFFSDIKISKKIEEATSYYKGQAKKYWNKKSLYPKGMLALAMYRMNEDNTANDILRSIKENSITSDEQGMYWKENKSSWYWHEAQIETQALMIEAFGEIQNNTKTIDDLKVWLLKNKQTNQWNTTKATTEAIYALLLQGSDWLSVGDAVDVVIGGMKMDPSQLEEVKIEAGTGYYKTSWNANDITPKMATVQLSKKGKGIAWGALYWQYFEQLDKITSADTPLRLKKKLFLKKNTDAGEELSEIIEDTDVKVGNLVRVRIELRADRDMEFLHMKDMRAAGFEPLNVLSQYKWQDGLGYYESTKDASTNFFFDYLPKGVYVFEYDLRVNNAGTFSNGITTIQSMYAPEFSSHSKGIRVKVVK